MNKYVKDTVDTVVVKTFYVYRSHKNNGSIDFVKAYNKKDGCKWIDVVTMHNNLLKGQWIAWSGEYDDSNKQFINLGLVCPCIVDGKKYLRSCNDGNEDNNLDNLAESKTLN